MSDAVLDTWPRVWRPRMRLARRAVRAWSRQRPRQSATTPRRRTSARTATAVALLAAALCLLAFSAWGLAHLRAAAVPLKPATATAPEWIDVPRPVRIFDLEALPLRGRTLVYTARRRLDGDGREDVLAFGVPGLDSPSLRLRLDRRFAAAPPQPPLFAFLAQLAADAGLSVSRSTLADLLPTRFGAFEIADVALTDGAKVDVPCTGFRRAQASPVLTIGGLACGAPGMPMSRAALSCLLDRLDLASGGDDRAMIDFFAASERHRDAACLGARLAPDGLHAAWLDDKAVTHLKTRRRH